MTRPSTRESRHASSTRQRSPGDGNSGDGRFLAIVGFAAVLLSTVVSSASYGLLPNQIRVHWTLGTGPYYGPEFAPAIVVFTAFPLLVAVTALGGYWGRVRLRHSEAFAAVRSYYVAAVFGAFLSLLGTQIALVVANV